MLQELFVLPGQDGFPCFFHCLVVPGPILHDDLWKIGL